MRAQFHAKVMKIDYGPMQAPGLVYPPFQLPSTVTMTLHLAMRPGSRPLEEPLLDSDEEFALTFLSNDSMLRPVVQVEVGPAVPKRELITGEPAIDWPTHGDVDYDSRLAAACERTGEPCFVIRAQDRYSGSAVRSWAMLVRLSGGDEKIAREAEKLADQMDAWPHKKEPDL